MIFSGEGRLLVKGRAETFTAYIALHDVCYVLCFMASPKSPNESLRLTLVELIASRSSYLFMFKKERSSEHDMLYTIDYRTGIPYF